jgi:hypothetical protein
MKMPTTILSIILAAITLTSANDVAPNPSGLKLNSISPGTIPAAMPPEDIHEDIQPLSNGLVDSPPAYFDDCGVLVQSLECRSRR